MAERAAESTEALYVDNEPQAVPTDHAAEELKARRLAARYQLEFVDLEHFHIDHALFRSIPADLMLRCGFVPYRRDGNTLLIVVSDPSDLQTIDEVGVQLRNHVCVSGDSEHQEERGEPTRAEISEGFQIQLLREDERGREPHGREADVGDSPVIRLVDSMVFGAATPRQTSTSVQDDAMREVRIDGVLQR
jgi:type IV pilus assembly protein PilB